MMRERPSFSKLRSDFAWDGSFRDIYILNTDASDWDRLGSILEKSNFKLAHFVDGQRAPVPTSFANRITDLHCNASLLVVFLTDVLSANCHFFTSEEIEFDIDPRLVCDQNDYARVLDFIEFVARELGKPALLTPENFSSAPILSYDPRTEAWSYFPESEV